MIPLSTIISRIRTRYESASGGSSTRWTDARIKDFVNEGLQSLAESTLFYERYCTVPLQEDVTWYDLRGFTPEVVVRIKSVYCNENNSWLEPSNPLKLDSRWEDATGTPQRFWTRGIYYLGVYPKWPDAPTTDNSTRSYIRVYFAGIPHAYENTQMVLRDLPDDHIEALIYYVLYEMNGIDGETQMSLHYWNKYQTRENELSRFVDARVDGARISAIGGNVV